MTLWTRLCKVLLLSPLLPFSGHAQDAAPKKEYAAWSKGRASLEVKGGYFFFSDSKMRKIYNAGGWDVQFSSSVPVWEWLQVYGSVEYLERHGKSLGGGQKTWLWEFPLSFGLKPVIPIASWATYYVALGPRYVFVRVTNDSSYVDHHIHKSGIGGFINTGFNFEPIQHFLIDVFGEYSYKKLDLSSSSDNVYGSSAQVGGVTFGLGLGYLF